MTNNLKVGIIGGAGYTAGELTRILLNHPSADITYSQSGSNAGNLISSVHQDLIGDTDMKFSTGFDQEVDVIFLCKGHGQSRTFLSENALPGSPKIIDLSHDYRLKKTRDGFVYGLPELNHSAIATAEKVANPGCFATCIQLGLLPVFDANVVEGDVSISGITGSTGAGQALSRTSHFSWRNNNMSVYKALKHQHLQEIGESVIQLLPDFSNQLLFIPYRGNFPRGIITTSHFSTSMSNKEMFDCYSDYYGSATFTHVTDQNPDLKMVVNTNKAIVFPQVIDSTAVVITVIDNLLKGASGQAVQNMNIMFGLDENQGLSLKTIAY
ncbi:MAG: N-acetyl-gamma-glutamyl-phosphate reductase [Cyclobacteriaceae bacterium]